MKTILATVLMLGLGVTSASAESLSNNEATKLCLAKFGYSVENFDSFDFSKAAACASDFRVAVNAENLKELRDFLKHNARYRVPGQSMNRCWGKPRVMPFDSAYIKQTPGGFEAGVSYKDTLPAGCYENAPWDNRDAKG
tara:strand:- start:173 stop:589 length:417 start_codon:yes stop_codon:yes gene_type:complete